MRSRPGSRGKPVLQPCLAELLRTCVYPSTLVLRVEKIFEEGIGEPRPSDGLSKGAAAVDGSHDPDESTYKLYLSDGEDMIQALLAPHLHPLLELGETNEGSLIELRKYRVRRAKRLRGKGEIIYLGVEDYVCISLSRPTTSEAQDEALLNGGGFLPEEDLGRIAPRRPQSQVPVPSSPIISEMHEQIPSIQESDVFETVQINPDKAKQRRQALHELSRIVRKKRGLEFEDRETPSKRHEVRLDEVSSSQESDQFEEGNVDYGTAQRRRQAADDLRGKLDRIKNEHDECKITPTQSTKFACDPISPFKNKFTAASPELRHPLTNPSPTSTPLLHTLHSLIYPPTPLPPKNYPVTILAVISWISPTLVSRPGSPFPPKRHLKLHDPSITSRQVGVSISVFIDAATFRPRHGTVALFQGIMMQRYRDEVILNAYPGLRGSEWFVVDGERLVQMGYDVQAMRRWWDGRKRERAAGAATGNTGTVQEHAGALGVL